MNTVLPLSKFQKSIWTGQKMKPNVPLYNMVFTFDIYGSLDTNAFKKAYKLLSEQTTILKLVVDESDPENPIQKTIVPDGEIELIDATQLSNFDIENWLEQKNILDFDLTSKSYFTALIKLTDEHYVWYFNQHHLFTDAYSFQVVFKKLSSIYRELINGSDPSVLDDGDAYIQNFNALETDELKDTKDSTSYRNRSFSLYGSKFKEAAQTKSTRQIFDLDPNTVARILSRLAELKLRTFSPNLDLLSFLMTSLVVSFRNILEEEEKIHFSNIFSKRFSKDSKQIARPLLQIMHSKFELKDEDSFSDLYQKIYAFLIMRDISTKCEWHHCGHMDDHHYIRLHIHRYASDDNFSLAFDTKDGHGIPDLNERLHKDFFLTINTLCGLDPSIALADISIVAPAELDKLKDLAASCEVAAIDSQDNIQRKLLNQFETNKEETALYYKDETISYERLKTISFSVAKSIKNLTQKKNPIVVIHIPRSNDYMYAVLACMWSNATFVPVPFTFPEERLKYVAEDVGADLVIHGSKNFDSKTNYIHIKDCVNQEVKNFEVETKNLNDDMYVLYTSGSSGKPKGVQISVESFSNYIKAITPKYLDGESYHMPLFTSVGFDLTMTTVFLPLSTGGSIHIYEDSKGIDLSIQDVILNPNINCLKCTPSHLRLIENTLGKNLKSIIVGGENLTRQLVETIIKKSTQPLNIFNEYGPTEATVGCIVYQYDSSNYCEKSDVPIGRPLGNYFAFIAKANGVPVPKGAVGEICIAGKGLARKYINDNKLTEAKFIKNNSYVPSRFYKTGDYGRINDQGDFEYLGRKDKQVKVAGIRVEMGEIEQASIGMDQIDDCVVLGVTKGESTNEDYNYCNKCGLPSNYPTADFNEENICGYCRSFESYKTKVEKYFKTEDDFINIFNSSDRERPEYDCIMLFSGGKDSSYALGKLVEKGLRVLAFTLDNGYISNSAKENIKRIVSTLGVDHIFGISPAMNEIFVESLETHCNVCNGCFKTIYNLSLKIAFEKQIPFIVTGLSRGQFFETKLSEEIFWKPMEDVKEIERTLFEARQAYHSVKDIAYEKTGGKFIEENAVLERVRILDFYRYHDVTLEELYNYIKTKLPWIRPGDTGRSTNCLINKLGIYVHKQEKGYSNYAFPYSWDVRTGHKTKAETIDEIEEYIDEKEVKQIIEEIGYVETQSSIQLVAYYMGKELDSREIKSHVRTQLPDYMVPSKYVHVDQFPLTKNGKIDIERLKRIKSQRTINIKPPSNEIEEILHPIWQEVMGIKSLSVDDDFFDLGGTSLDAIRIVSRLEAAINYKLTVNYIFEYPSIQSLSEYIMSDMRSILASNSN